MKDLILALMGHKHCEWCVRDKPPSWWEHKMRFDIAMRTDSRPWYERLAIRLSDGNEKYLPIWKLGQWWHWKFHEHS